MGEVEMNRSIWLPLLVLMAGCASGGSGIPSPDAMQRAVNDAFVGRSVEAMAARYGIPHLQDEFRGETIYLWNADKTMRWSGPDAVSTTSGKIGNQTRYPFREVPFRTTTKTSTFEDVKYSCRLEAAIGADGTVRAVGFVGQMGACQVFMP